MTYDIGYSQKPGRNKYKPIAGHLEDHHSCMLWELAHSSKCQLKTMEPPHKNPRAIISSLVKTMSATPVFFHVSSLIGYVRVVLSAYALYVALDDCKTSLFCYVVSFVLDFFDGYFSRCLHESPRFHSILDTVTDRCSTGGLLVVLSHLYPSLMHVFLFLLILDFSSHWYHMQSSHGPHKRVCSDRNYLLRLYYGVYPFFGYCCIGTELFYLLMYTLHFHPTLVLPVVDVSLQSICLRVCLPACIMKSLVNIAQLASAAYSIADEDASHED